MLLLLSRYRLTLRVRVCVGAMVVLWLHLHTVMITVSVRFSRCLSISLLSEPLEQLANRVVIRNGESHLIPLSLLLSLHISDLSEDYL